MMNSTSTLFRIKKILDDYFGIDMSSRSRKSTYVEARMMYYHFIFNNILPRPSLSKIGKPVNRNHATVLHGLDTFDVLIESDYNFKRQYIVLEKILIETLDLSMTIKTERLNLLERIDTLENELIQLKKENNRLLNKIENDREKLLFSRIPDDYIDDFVKHRLKPYLRMIERN